MGMGAVVVLLVAFLFMFEKVGAKSLAQAKEAIREFESKK